MSMGLSLLRDFVLSVPLVLILPLMFGVEGPLFSAPIADVITILVTCVMMRSVMKELQTTTRQEEVQIEEIEFIQG